MNEQQAPKLGTAFIEGWEHAGLRCVIMGHPRLGTANGYVQLPTGHPDLGKGYDDIDVDVHGGITYGCDGDGWVGFDTAHAGDYWREGEIPPGRRSAEAALEALEFGSLGGPRSAVEWTLDRLRAEVNQFAEQLAARVEPAP